VRVAILRDCVSDVRPVCVDFVRDAVFVVARDAVVRTEFVTRAESVLESFFCTVRPAAPAISGANKKSAKKHKKIFLMFCDIIIPQN
jgi:hypothetical protein